VDGLRGSDVCVAGHGWRGRERDAAGEIERHAVPVCAYEGATLEGRGDWLAAWLGGKHLLCSSSCRRGVSRRLPAHAGPVQRGWLGRAWGAIELVHPSGECRPRHWARRYLLVAAHSRHKRRRICSRNHAAKWGPWTPQPSRLQGLGVARHRVRSRAQCASKLPVRGSNPSGPMLRDLPLPEWQRPGSVSASERAIQRPHREIRRAPPCLAMSRRPARRAAAARALPNVGARSAVPDSSARSPARRGPRSRIDARLLPTLR
jgi:hypothetical protein